MARNRKEFSPAGQARFLALVAQGWTAKAIADDLNAMGEGTSRQTVDVRMREVRGNVATPRGSRLATLAPPDSDPTLPDDLPTEADVEAAAATGAEAVAALIQKFTERALKADTAGNLAVAGRYDALLLHAHKLASQLTPPARPDPNDQPDMVKLGAEVEARFFKMIDLVAEEYDPRAA